MTNTRTKSLKLMALGGSALGALALAAPAAAADFQIAGQDLQPALQAFAAQGDQQVLFSTDAVAGKRTAGFAGDADPERALQALLAGTGLTFRRDGETFLISQQGEGGNPQGGGAGAGNAVQALIVTAQKREEDIQDVPIAISAFSQEDLTRSQVAGGPDLMTQVPNMTFTKTNFSSYSIQIRGIGTQAISATTDPAVAVAFNNTPFVRNRFFEQEFFDLERLEVLRGPQGTLYGRNATAGVVNIISAKPKFYYEAKASADVGNYGSTRIEGMVNIPLVEDAVALRVAGAWTRRDGYATNQLTGGQIDGRDLWSGRVSLRFEPTDRISANLIYEHFQEDDDRLRSGKQLCKKHVVTEVGGLPLDQGTGSAQSPAAYLSQGCVPTSLYSEEAFQTPNGNALPYFAPLADIGLPIVSGVDPYLSATQSRDLRVIESSVEPDYRANSDLAELQVSIDLSDNLTLTSETSYSADSLFSLQDYNRFTTAGGVFRKNATVSGGSDIIVDADGVFCDPQIGCTDRLMLVDLSTSDSTQFSQEFRLGSNFPGPFNFSLGANYLRHDTVDKYYVFINTISLWAAYQGNVSCRLKHPGDEAETGRYTDPSGVHSVTCPYMDPNPIASLNDMGTNYFLSTNPFKLISYAGFGEAYYNVTPDLKITAGLRFTVDRKIAPQIPSWLLGESNGPYMTSQTIVQEWREPTGRLAIDWKPVLGFTDETLVYASYAHGYKAGGANPPPPVFATYGDATSLGQEIIPDTFDPEYVDAIEVGTKNTLLGGALTLNLTGFYYDYKNYQVSEIRNRSAVNSNYDAEAWGAELEIDWRASDALRLGFKGGYEKTRIADGESAVDLMDRTAGHDDWMVVRPFPTVPSNCILPLYLLTAGGQIHAGFPISGVTSWNGDCIDAYYNHLDPLTRLPYVKDPTQWYRPLTGIVNMPSAYDDYPGFDYRTAPNGGRGFSKALGGNELPNAPQFTATVTADYTLPLANDWMLTLHGDYHYQSKSYWRVFNDLEYDRLKAFSTVNFTAIFANEDAGWTVMAYVKNAFDETALTGAFLNSDDTGLTTNVFLTEPRLYGLRVTKGFDGGGWLGGFGGRHEGPYPLQVEIGGAASRLDGSTDTYRPDWVTPALAPALSVQDQDLDWGDIRDVKVTWAPAGGWRVSGAYLYGKTNAAGRGAAYEDVPGGLFFFFGPIGVGAGQYRDIDNYIVDAFLDSEEHAITDFMVGKDVGLGAFGEGGRSTLSAGLRYASFKSTSHVAMNGTTGAYTPDAWAKYSTFGQHQDVYTTALDSVREFEGAGPTLSWDASIRLAGSDEAGHADLDWTVGGGVLFGKQTMASDETRFGGYYDLSGGLLVFSATPEAVHYDDVVERRRSKRVTVPNLSLSLGLSYTVDRIKVSTGYSYDRFFDAIDGGYKDAQSYDRTIQGPYFKLAVGFGG